MAQLESKEGPRIIVGSYTPNDAIRDFVDAIASLATATTATCQWHQGPGIVTWRFIRTTHHIQVTIDSPESSAEYDFRWIRFASDVLAAMQTIRSSMGESAYEREWLHPFPRCACEKLEKAIRGE